MSSVHDNGRIGESGIHARDGLRRTRIWEVDVKLIDDRVVVLLGQGPVLSLARGDALDLAAAIEAAARATSRG